MILQLPIYVQQIKTGYLVKPLFFQLPQRTDTELHRLITKFTRDVVLLLEKLAKADRQADIARWAFSPTVSTQRLPVVLELRRRTVRVNYLLVTFEHLGKRFAFTPSIPGLWFEYARHEQHSTRAAEVFNDYWRQLERDADEEESIRPEADALSGQAWVQDIPISFQVPRLRKKPTKDLFMILGGGADLPDGASELHRVGRCLDWLYPSELDRASFRDHEVQELEQLLLDPDNRPVLLVGPRLVGKSAIIQECVYRRMQLRQGKRSSRSQVWLISPQRLVSGMSYVGQWESRLLSILKHVAKREHVLYFDDLIGLFLAGRTSNSNLNVAQVLKPYLEDRRVRVLGEITPEGLRVLREQDRSFADLFQILPVREASDADNLRMLVSVQRQLEARHKCNFDLAVIPTVMALQRRYDRSAAFPGKAATVLNRLAIRIRGQHPDEPNHDSIDHRLNPLLGRAEIRREAVFAEFIARTGLALEFLDSALRLERDEVRDRLRQLVVGQSDAIEALADVISIAKARLNDPDRPLAAFLFLGPTGVGKTESAKAVARTLFGNEERLIRFDLNEYNQPGSAARLVGTLSQPEGLLTAAIRRQPFSVILLDELEKADHEVFDVLLQVLGEGRLTDALGRTADFTNAIIIMTSNLGVRESEGGVGFVANADQSGVFTRAAERFFRPEFFNRLDRVIPFRKLTRDEMGRIAQRLVDGVLQREGFAQRRCVLSVSPEALDRVITAGYDPVLGARAMKRAVEEQLTRPAATRLAALSQESLTIVSIGSDQSGLTIAVQAPAIADRIIRETSASLTERMEAYRSELERILTSVEPLRPTAGISGKVTPEQERYYAVKERADEIADRLDQLEDFQEQQRLTRLGSGSSHAFTRRPRYRTINEPKDYNPDGRSAIKVLMSAENMIQAVEEILQNLQPVDEDQELHEIDRQLALLRLMASCPSDDRPTFLWIRGYPEGPPSGLTEELARLYHDSWNESLGLEVKFSSDSLLHKSESVLEIRGQHARPFAELEVGTHLFLPKHGGPVPIRVAVLDHVPTMADQDIRYGPILRVYPQDKPLIDARSGLVAPRPVALELFRSFTLAVLP